MDPDTLKAWFSERPKWQQEAARRLLVKGALSASDIEELRSMCLAEVACENIDCEGLDACSLALSDATNPLFLKSISDLEGINALAPTNPLNFGESPLCIVYGRNGAGKSGYVRLLKHACGCRNRGELLPNIFAPTARGPFATISYIENNEVKSARWTGYALQELKNIEVYDTASGLVYVNEENEVAHEPGLLRLFTEMTDACTTLNQLIQAEAARLVSKKPSLPPEFASTPSGAWYMKFSNTTSLTEVESNTAWTAQHQAQLDEARKRLAEPNPASQAASLRLKKEILLQLKTDLKNKHDALSDERCVEFILAESDAVTKRKAANEDAEKVFRKAPLSGIGSESWRYLWEAARRYSEELAYTDVPFPNMDEAAVCVLCQQTLNPESRDRFSAFEDFVKGELQSLAEAAEQHLQNVSKSFPALLQPEAVEIKLEAAGVLDQTVRDNAAEFARTLNKRKEACLALESTPELPTLAALVHLLLIARSYAAKARAFDKDALGQKRPALEKEVKELSARKWLSQQRDAIDHELLRLNAIQQLHEAKRLTSTTALSKQKSSLADELITKAYIQRFRDELKRLRASRIEVELRKTKAEVGRVYHQIFLKNASTKVNTGDILSEGEFRIVSLAAFLADSEGRGTKTPFVFDDPISSLDHVYEEAIARRLAELSQNRQVIVFTHRLSLIGFLNKYAGKLKIKPNILSLSRYRTGDIAELPIDLKKTDKAVNGLLGERIARVKRALENGDAAYEVEAKALCRDTRTLLERVIECDMLNEVLKRFSPEVNTKGRIHALAKITQEECAFLDEYMTKYSRYEHSQPEEAPIELPLPEEIESDLGQIRSLILTIQARNKDGSH